VRSYLLSAQVLLAFVVVGIESLKEESVDLVGEFEISLSSNTLYITVYTMDP
jgi:hypothetical protein